MRVYKNMVAISPGETIKDELDYLEMTQSEFAKRMGMAEKTISLLINGEHVLSYETSLKLENVLGIPASMWNKLEAQYREVLVRIEEEKALEKEWIICEKFPLKEMMKRKWIPNLIERLEIVRELRNYFGIASLNYLTKVEEKLFNQNPLFRRDEEREICEFSMVSWIRKGEIEANQIVTEPFVKDRLKEILPEMKKLSQINSHESIKKLKELCRNNGIVLVILPNLPKTYVNGVSKWLGKDKAIIILSNKGKKIDAFWFNFFHELGHILYHNKKEIFVSTKETEKLEIEEEANQFAKDILISKKNYNKLISLEHNEKNIIQLGKELSIHPSILLGILQYDGIISYKTTLNKLKEDIIL